MVGAGARWEALEFLFDSTCKRLGLNQKRNSADGPVRKKREQPQQIGLFNEN